ncbi:hypothetical protein EWM64_g7472 [Hericium alpestre]|uniref:Uncharacterized protein n=1 Tax=Hericium alpestre TaxID=135208 RepID=A0A4Y9ZSS9_9AGAM|nr:hypothetical protein EWM64_g7472 [Hericium alpestre]
MEASDEELEKIEIGDADNELCSCYGNYEPYWPDEQPWWEWYEDSTEWEWFEEELYGLAAEC